ncbi:alpha/beta hydrolase [Williamsia sterculiae]|uniref:Alpha/beta hydrolase n=1 Tax=Williamsia sterculiae TaxID=1344003 RepID=A0A1N7HB60_9NOCA|nr:alpha/beta hydrolase [Williamsia sterculiae]SIS22062.1 Alpha/beta hydrolase [Williamsia sterculiae]
MRSDDDMTVDELRELSPVALRRAFAAMAEARVQQMIDDHPAFIGNTDGVPFRVRIAANAHNLRDAVADEVRQGRSDGVRAHSLRVLLTPEHRRERRFITFANTAAGRVIEMAGEFTPTTTTAAVYVPGTGTRLDESVRNHEAAWNLARRTGGPVFLFMDGDLPQDMGHTTLLRALRSYARAETSAVGPIGWFTGTVSGVGGFIRRVLGSMAESAMDPTYAIEMAPRLVEFARQLDQEIAEHCPGTRTTVIGHSYGGSVVGTAEQLGLRADRVVHASSAGAGVLDGGWRNPNPTVERFSMTAPGDLIQYVRWLPANPHGAKPDSMPGVFRMDTGWYDDRSRDELVQGPSGHGEYWNHPDSTAFANLVRVIRGERPTPFVRRVDERPLAVLWQVLRRR